MPPASTTPAALSSGRSDRVCSSALRAPASAAARASPASGSAAVRTVSLPPVPALVRSAAAAAAPSSTVRMVPSFGSATAPRAAAAAARSARAVEGASAPRLGSAAQKPRSTWDRITPEFPRAPVRAACAIVSAMPATSGGPTSGPAAPSDKAPTTARCVWRRFVPVSPSGTGKTFRESISSRNSSRACAYSAMARTSAGASSIRLTEAAG